MPGKKKPKKKGKKASKSSSTKVEVDPLKPDFVPPPPKPGQRLVKLLTRHPVDEKEVHGIKVSTRILTELTAQEIRDLRVIFEIFDSDSDGYILPRELKRAMKALGFRISKEEARQAIADVSLKGRGAVDFNEFMDIIVDRQSDGHDTYSEILKGFDIFDSDNTGTITMDNLRQACRDTGIRFTQEELVGMIEEADSNGDGVIDQSEFIKIMLETNLF